MSEDVKNLVGWRHLSAFDCKKIKSYKILDCVFVFQCLSISHFHQLVYPRKIVINTDSALQQEIKRAMSIRSPLSANNIYKIKRSQTRAKVNIEIYKLYFIVSFLKIWNKSWPKHLGPLIIFQRKHQLKLLTTSPLPLPTPPSNVWRNETCVRNLNLMDFNIFKGLG